MAPRGRGRAAGATRVPQPGRTRDPPPGGGPADGGGAAAEAGPDGVGVWRLFDVRLPLEVDPGKDAYTVTAELCAAAGRRLGCRDALPPSAVTLRRKSFDARPARNGRPAHKGFSYVVEVDDAAARACGARRLRPEPARVEWILGPEGPPDGAAPPPMRQPVLASRSEPVLVVGCGPAGLCAALALAEQGLPVVLFERGRPVERRGRDIGALFVRGLLDQDSNLCYGEGGAGTWSDGKLTTRIGRNSDPVRRVLQTLVAFGAPADILVAGKPHLGTDRLVRILRAFRQHLETLGVQIRFESRVEDLIVLRGRTLGLRLAGGEEIRGAAVVLAVGHSARSMYQVLASHGAALSAKPFALGFRIEHPQALIDRIQYGEEDAAGVMRGKGRIPVADYTLAATINEAGMRGVSHVTQLPISFPPVGSQLEAVPEAAASTQGNDSNYGAEGQLLGSCQQDGSPPEAGPPASSPRTDPQGNDGRRGVYSFCMCPGGQVVPTSTNPDELCVNGMSFSRRDSRWANAALVCSVGPSDWAHHVPVHGALAAVHLQRCAEREAAVRGGGGFVAPVQRVLDFVEGRAPPLGEALSSSYRLGVRSAALHDLYPEVITEALQKAVMRFEARMPGFLGPEGVLHGVETRTSAPVRVERNEECESVSLRGLYPCGEGAGYAGGIVSAAVDGLRVGEAVAQALACSDVLAA